MSAPFDPVDPATSVGDSDSENYQNAPVSRSTAPRMAAVDHPPARAAF